MNSEETREVHHLVAALVIEGQRILLGLRSPSRAFYPNVWDMFGGHIEPDEQPEQTLVRELQEELDITPSKWTAMGVMQDSVPGRDAMPAHDLVVYFFCVTAWEGRPLNRQPEEHSTIEWFFYEEAVQLDLGHPSYPQLFAQALQIVPGDNEGQ